MVGSQPTSQVGHRGHHYQVLVWVLDMEDIILKLCWFRTDIKNDVLKFIYSFIMILLEEIKFYFHIFPLHLFYQTLWSLTRCKTNVWDFNRFIMLSIVLLIILFFKVGSLPAAQFRILQNIFTTISLALLVPACLQNKRIESQINNYSLKQNIY